MFEPSTAHLVYRFAELAATFALGGAVQVDPGFRS